MEDSRSSYNFSDSIDGCRKLYNSSYLSSLRTEHEAFKRCTSFQIGKSDITEVEIKLSPTAVHCQQPQFVELSSRINELEEAVRKFVRYSTAESVSVLFSKFTPDLAEEYSGNDNREPSSAFNVRFDYFKQLVEFTSSWQQQLSKQSRANLNNARSILERLTSFLKEDAIAVIIRSRYGRECADDRVENSAALASNVALWRVDAFLMRCTVFVVSNLLSSCTEMLGKQVDESPSDIVHDQVLNVDDLANGFSQACTNVTKEELERIEWLETQKHKLEVKLKEKNHLESELENFKEENEALRGKVTELKRTIANMEIAELEYKFFQETVKYKEEDKRCKDALERTIADLRTQNDKLSSAVGDLQTENENLVSTISNLRSENENLLSTINVTKSENLRLKQAFQTEDSRIGNVPSCSNGNTIKTEESCCDMVREIKSLFVDLIEREFNCGICGDMFIEATVTNCNHVFCAYCLKEWKKKKKQCPFCRANITKECKAVVIDEYIMNLSKLVSDTMYKERMNMIEERKVADTPPPLKRPRIRGGSSRTAPVAHTSLQPVFYPNLITD